MNSHLPTWMLPVRLMKQLTLVLRRLAVTLTVWGFLIAMAAAIPFYLTAPIMVAIKGEPHLALAVAEWNVTHFPPSLGPKVRCGYNALTTPAAEELEATALRIGRELEAQHNLTFTAKTEISVFDSVESYQGVAVAGGINEYCIRLSLHASNPENTIRHEWAHIAAPFGAGHGPEWRELARKFGASTKGYEHCTVAPHPDGSC